MAKRFFDVVVSSMVLLVAWPVILVAALLTKIASPGPAFYIAKRVGRDERVFNMCKIRSMHMATDTGAVITAPEDRRIFPFGQFLRASKIDELPQFWNVLIGDMSLVGPRPEDPEIVTDYYTAWMLKTLKPRPGITSPGAVFGYLKGDEYLRGGDAQQAYVDRLLPKKLRIELEYLQKATFRADLGVIYQTARAIVVTVFRK